MAKGQVVRGTPYTHIGPVREGIAPGQPKGADGQTTMQQFRGTGMDTVQSPRGTPYNSQAGNPGEFSRTVESDRYGKATSDSAGDQNDPAVNGSGVVLDGATRANGWSTRGAPYPDSPVPKSAPFFDTRTVEEEDKAHMGSGFEDTAECDLMKIPDGVMSRG